MIAHNSVLLLRRLAKIIWAYAIVTTATPLTASAGLSWWYGEPTPLYLNINIDFNMILARDYAYSLWGTPKLVIAERPEPARIIWVLTGVASCSLRLSSDAGYGTCTVDRLMVMGKELIVAPTSRILYPYAHDCQLYDAPYYVPAYDEYHCSTTLTDTGAARTAASALADPTLVAALDNLPAITSTSTLYLATATDPLPLADAKQAAERLMSGWWQDFGISGGPYYLRAPGTYTVTGDADYNPSRVTIGKQQYVVAVTNNKISAK